MSLLKLLICSIIFFSMQSLAFAIPDGHITFFNASNNSITAAVGNYGRFTLAAKESKDVDYTTLQRICSDASHCSANFYVNDQHAGSATINALTGELLYIHLTLNVSTTHNAQNILRSVTIK